MKVLYLINHPVPYGANVALLNILDGIVKNNVTPMVVMGSHGAICKDLEVRNINYEIIPYYFSVYPRLKSLRDYILFLPRLTRLFITNHKAIKKLIQISNKFKPDIIHTNIGPAHIGFHVSKKLNIPHVWHIREYQNLDFNLHPIPSMLGFSNKLRKQNNYSIAITYDLLKHFKIKTNSQVIYDGVTSKLNTQFVLKKESYFLFVGRLVEAKGIEQLIDAFIEFSKSNKTHILKIAGDGNKNYVKKLIKKVDKSSLKNRIVFLGFRNDVYDLMAKATALIVPSRSEGFGFITAEAMFNGCLVIGNNSGGTKEIIEEDEIGILFSGKDELIKALDTVVKKGIENYFPMIQKAQGIAKSKYSKEQNVENIMNLYYSILKHHENKDIG